MRILILGGGAHAQTIADVLLQLADAGRAVAKQRTTREMQAMEVGRVHTTNERRPE